MKLRLAGAMLAASVVTGCAVGLNGKVSTPGKVLTYDSEFEAEVACKKYAKKNPAMQRGGRADCDVTGRPGYGQYIFTKEVSLPSGYGVTKADKEAFCQEVFGESAYVDLYSCVDMDSIRNFRYE